jgi:hypothetical protein
MADRIFLWPTGFFYDQQDFSMAKGVVIEVGRIKPGLIFNCRK